VTVDGILWRLRPRLEAALKRNQKSFATYEEARSRYVETRSVDHLASVLHPDTVYRNLEYSAVLDTGEELVGEFDGLIVVDTFMVLVEAKARTMRASGERGAPDSLKTEIEAIIEHGLDQLAKHRRALAPDATLKLRDANGKAVELDRSNVTRTVGILVTLE